MKTILIMSALFLLTVSVASAEEKADTLTIKGVLIDNQCAQANKDKLLEFIKTHPKDCVLMPSCAASGLAIYADGKLTEFDTDSNAKILAFLKEKDSKLEVEVVAKKAGEKLSLVSIKNQ